LVRIQSPRPFYSFPLLHLRICNANVFYETCIARIAIEFRFQFRKLSWLEADSNFSCPEWKPNYSIARRRPRTISENVSRPSGLAVDSAADPFRSCVAKEALELLTTTLQGMTMPCS
jgi:hypothetical protein